MLLRPSNREIAQLLSFVAAAYQALGENRFKIIAYKRAADVVDQLTVELTALWEKGELVKLPGIGPSIAGYLSELMETGKVSHFEAVFAKMPHGMMSLLKLAKVGGKTAFKLAVALNKAHALGHASDKAVFAALEKAIRNGSIDVLEGFGPKKSQEFLTSIVAFRKGATKEIRMPFPVADEIAREVIVYLQQLSEVQKIDALGSLRRKVATIGDIDIAVATSNKKKVVAHFTAYPYARSVVEHGDQGATIALSSGATIDLRVGESRSYGAMLQYFTGSKQHNINLREFALKKGLSLSEYGIKEVAVTGLMHEFFDEEGFYRYLGLQYVEPELRENTGEIELAASHKLPKLVELRDIKGDVHIHSDFDLQPSHDLGISSMNEILNEAGKFNYTYLGISDHNPKQSGMTDSDINDIMKRRKKYFDNKKYFTKSVQNKCTVQKVFVMLEIDIKPDGQLALPNGSFQYLDAAIASIHSGFTMPAALMTKRIIHALSNLKVRVLGHPTGRLINKRESIQADWEDIFRCCKEKGIALEINAHPSRLDLPDMLVHRAVQMGVKLIIDTDSHAATDLNLMTYGVSVARRGWATKGDIINTRPLNEFEKWLKNCQS